MSVWISVNEKDHLLTEILSGGDSQELSQKGCISDAEM